MPATFSALGLNPGLALVFLVALVAAPIVYDLAERGRPHVVTVIGLIVVIGSVPVAMAATANESIRTFVLQLR